MNGLSLLPSRCILCGGLLTDGKLICAKCAEDGLLIRGKICRYCGMEKDRCACRDHKRYYERRIACVYYEGGARRGMARLNFYRHTMLAHHYGRMMAVNVGTKYGDIPFDHIVPVPMRRWDKIKRGYNCPELLARRISEDTGVPLLKDGLYKRRRTKPQKRLRPGQRAANVLDAFSTRHASLLKDKTILLVDDVATTGATLNECAKILRLAGARKVYAVTFAAVPQKKVE